MEKEIYLIRGENSESYAEFTEAILSLGNSLVEKIKPEKLKLTITTNKPPRISIIPFEKSKIAAISLFKNDSNPIEMLLKHPELIGAYKVTEALPVAYDKTWEDKKPSPGVCLLTLFRQKKGISYDTFIDKWHNGHTPLSLQIHPLWNYNRNVVNNTITDDSTIYDGIVEEHLRTSSDLLNPFKFFGNPLMIIPNMIKVYTDVKSFLDYKSIESYLTTEYHLISSFTTK